MAELSSARNPLVRHERSINRWRKVGFWCSPSNRILVDFLTSRETNLTIFVICNSHAIACAALPRIYAFHKELPQQTPRLSFVFHERNRNVVIERNYNSLRQSAKSKSAREGQRMISDLQHDPARSWSCFPSPPAMLRSDSFVDEMACGVMTN